MPTVPVPVSSRVASRYVQNRRCAYKALNYDRPKTMVATYSDPFITSEPPEITTIFKEIVELTHEKEFPAAYREKIQRLAHDLLYADSVRNCRDARQLATLKGLHDDHPLWKQMEQNEHHTLTARRAVLQMRNLTPLPKEKQKRWWSRK